MDSRASPRSPALANLAGAPGQAIRVDSREVRRVSVYPPDVSLLPLQHQRHKHIRESVKLPTCKAESACTHTRCNA